jgi:predicted RNA-binding protein (virulence factor B family)
VIEFNSYVGECGDEREVMVQYDHSPAEFDPWPHVRCNEEVVVTQVFDLAGRDVTNEVSDSDMNRLAGEAWDDMRALKKGGAQ